MIIQELTNITRVYMQVYSSKTSKLLMLKMSSKKREKYVENGRGREKKKIYFIYFKFL